MKGCATYGVMQRPHSRDLVSVQDLIGTFVLCSLPRMVHTRHVGHSHDAVLPDLFQWVSFKLLWRACTYLRMVHVVCMAVIDSLQLRIRHACVAMLTLNLCIAS